MDLETQIVDIVKKVNEEMRLADKRAAQLYEKIVIKKAGELSSFQIETYATDPNKYSHLRLRTSDSDVLDTLSETQDGDELGKIHFQGVDTGPNWDEGAWIKVVQNGVAGAYVPADMFLESYSATARNTNQLVLHHDGGVGIGVADPGNYRLYVAGGSGLQVYQDGADCTVIIHEDAGTHNAQTRYRRGTVDWYTGMLANNQYTIMYETTAKLTVDAAGDVVAAGCVSDSTCEIMKNEDALAIIDDILKTGSGKKDEYNHERMDMKKIHAKYPFMIYEQIPEGEDEKEKKYFDKLGAKSDLIYVAIGQLKEKIEALEAQLNN